LSSSVDNIKKNVVTVADCQNIHLSTLLQKYGLNLVCKASTNDIPGSYWGDSEAGLIANTIYVRNDTPIHSLLHESCHYICMDANRRDVVDTNAAGDYDEENGVCYLQILLANDIPEVGSDRMMEDMDTWGYTFRLGSAKAWFNEDAEDALYWLQKHKILDQQGKVNYTLRIS